MSDCVIKWQKMECYQSSHLTLKKKANKCIFLRRFLSGCQRFILLAWSDLKQEVKQLKMCCTDVNSQCQGEILTVTWLSFIIIIILHVRPTESFKYFIKQTYKASCSRARRTQIACRSNWVLRTLPWNGCSRSLQSRPGIIVNYSRNTAVSSTTCADAQNKVYLIAAVEERQQMI